MGSPQKVCIVCHQDCSAKPRTKDEAGRYTCNECVAKTAAKPQVVIKPAARASMPQPVGAGFEFDDGVDLRGAASAEASAPVAELDNDHGCPKCSGFMETGQAVCVRCGFDRVHKHAIRTRIEKAPKENKKTYHDYGSIFGMILAPLVLIAGIVPWFAPEIGLYTAYGCYIACAVSFITVRICQIADGDWLWFWIGWFSGASDFIWIFTQHRGWLKLLVLCSAAGTISAFFALGTIIASGNFQ